MTNIICVLTNEAMPSLVKIGFMESLEERIKSLSAHSGVPLPDLSIITAVLEAASKIAPGEAARKAAEGAAHVPMALPSAAEVAAAHADAAAKRAAAEAAKLNTDTQQGELAALYPEAQKLAFSLINTVEFQLGEREDLDDASRRRIARLWGLVCLNDDGSAAEESGNDAPKPATAPTP